MQQETTARLTAGHLRERLTLRGTAGDLLAEGILADIKPDYLELRSEGKEFSPMAMESGSYLYFQVNNKEGVPFFGVGQLLVATPKHIRITDYAPVNVSERREAFRVHTRLRGQLTLMVNNARGVPVARTISVTVQDLSLNGLFFLMPAGQLDVGQKVDVRVLLRYDHFDFTCRVRRLVEKEGERGYGCSFEELSPAMSDKLCAFLFRVQAEELRRMRKTPRQTEE